MLRTPKTEQELDLLHGALRALYCSKADYMNFVLPSRFPPVSRKPEEPPSNDPVPHYTINARAVGLATVEYCGESRSYPVHRITQNGEKVMDIVPQLRSIYEEEQTE